MILKDLLPLFGVSSIAGTFVLVVKGIALLRTTRIERLVMTDQKKIIITLVEYLVSSLMLTIVGVYVSIQFNKNEPIELFAALFLVFFILSLVATPALWGIVNI